MSRDADPARHASLDRVIVVAGQPLQLSWLGRIVRTVVDTAETSASLSAARLDDPFGLLVIDDDNLGPDERRQLDAVLDRARQWAEPPEVLLVSSTKDGYAERFGEFERLGLMNLLAKNKEVDPAELIVTIQKLLRRDIFGLDKYFVWGVESEPHTIRRSEDRGDLVAEAEAYARDLSIHPRLVDQFCTVVDELLTNALYNAPVDAEGRRRFAHVPRSQPVELDPGEEIEVRWCSDARYLGVSVSDSFGTLADRHSVGYLAKCFRRMPDQIDTKEGGAGLGFYVTFNALSHFVLNIAAGRRTEVIGLVDVRGGYRDFADKSKSFNVFVEHAHR